MSTSNDHKRRKYNEEDNDDVKKSSSSAADSNVEEEEDDDGSNQSASDVSYSTSPQTTTFVAWLDKPSDNDNTSNNNILSIGELHFSNAEHIAEATTDDDDEEDDEEKDDGSYCIVCQLKLVPNDGDEDEESDLVYTFKDSFPFRVLKSSSCIVGLPLIPIAANGLICNSNILHHITDVEKFFSEEEGPFDYLLCGDLRSSLLQELQDLSQSNKNESPNWEVSIPNDQDVIDGINSWWKAGEEKTGWNLSNIPNEDYTTLQTIHDEEKKGPGDNDNILMSLYKDLCAFEPLVMDDNLTRDMIEDRFEWRTCLCTYFAWAVPNEAALNAIASLNQPILEIGAGTGYWAWLLTQRNVNITAYDLADSHAGEKDRFRHSLVQDGGVEKVSCKEYTGHALMLCWPDIVGDEAITDADRGTFGVDTLHAYKGKTVIYIGELGPNVCRTAKGWGDTFPPGGSSSSAAFQEELHSNFELVKRVELPNWPPYNSHLTIWNRKEV